MKKTIIQGIITVLLFFGTWFALTQIDWVKVFKVQQVTDKTEQKLGELFWEVFKKTEKESQNPLVINCRRILFYTINERPTPVSITAILIKLKRWLLSLSNKIVVLICRKIPITIAIILLNHSVIKVSPR